MVEKYCRLKSLLYICVIKQNEKRKIMKKLEFYTQKNKAVEVVINHASAERKGTGFYRLVLDIEINGESRQLISGTHDMPFIDDLDSKFDIEAIYKHKESVFSELIEEEIYFLCD